MRLGRSFIENSQVQELRAGAQLGGDQVGEERGSPQMPAAPHSGELPQKPFLLGVRLEGPRSLGWGMGGGAQPLAARGQQPREKPGPRSRRRTERPGGACVGLAAPRCTGSL